MIGTFWALVPPLIAIILALITKEVYSSLFIGIAIGGFFFAGGHPVDAMNHILNDGFITMLSDSGNVGIIIFLVLLGGMVCLLNKAGGSAAFGKWAMTHIKGRVGAQLVTILLGCIIFIDDYFNCLTVGSVMTPVARAHNVSRAKLAYLIDSTAAPICIIAPISSWAAAVTGFVDGEDGLSLFVNAIPYNFYALLTLVFMIGIVITKVDYGPMARDEREAIAEILTEKEETKDENLAKGKVIDLVLPIIILIIACVCGMVYTGGFFSGEDFVTAFANSNSSVGLVIGSSVSMVITIIYLLLRRVISFKDSMSCFVEGFNAMVPAILILTFAWTLKAMTDSLGAREFVSEIVASNAQSFAFLLPAIIFVIACFLGFSTGTSWGTFGILIPIVVSIFQGTDPQMMIISISACMAGAVCGDHCSPISDTTIMSSAGAQCDHVEHVSTQLPYALTVASISFVTYILAGIVKSAAICLPFGIVVVIALLLVIKKLNNKKATAA